MPGLEEVAPSPPGEAEGEPRLVRGDDGLLYALGDFESAPRPGQLVFGTYGGDWPLEETPAPALFAGEVVKVLSDGVVRVHGLYEFPDRPEDELQVHIVDTRGEESMGKGLDVVEAVFGADEAGEGQSPFEEVEFGLGRAEGVQEGDMYAVIRPYDPQKGAGFGQLSRRLSNVCRVVDVGVQSSTCRLRQGHPHHHGQEAAAEVGDFVVFLEPRLSPQRRKGRILVSQVEDEDVNEAIRAHLEEYFAPYPGGNVSVEFFDQSGDGPPLENWQGRGGEGAERWADKEIDARDTEFFRWGRRLETDEPALLVGVSLEDGQVVLNYTGLGGAVGPGMVAAPPEGGVEMGPVDNIGDESWIGFASMLKGAMLVYRGETSEALMHLHQALDQSDLQGPWRWHARDQRAMRWAALDRFEEALWLVYEDEAQGRANDDDQALYNAMGTRVRLHDYLEQHQVAYEAAREYLDAHQGEAGVRGIYLSALAMFAEMAAQVGEFDETREAIDELHELCPKGCEGDLLGLLAGIYWAVMDDESGLQDELVEQMVDVGERDPATSLAYARMFQGWNHMREDDMDWAMVAFREALRRFEQENMEHGAARAKFYLAITLMERDELEEAYVNAIEALQYMTEIGDYSSMARIYERMAFLFVPFDPDATRGLYLAAPRFLRDGLQAQMGTGDYGRASEAGFAYAHFLLSSGSLDEARRAFDQAATRAIRTARFDMVALSNLFLAMIAEYEGDMQTYQRKIEQAKAMAALADEPFVDELIEEFLSPSDSQEAEDPTQFL